jgi:hypothetical protein
MLFAHMKQHFRFTRLKLRGLAGAAEEFLFVATVQNLRRLVQLKPDETRKTPCRLADEERDKIAAVSFKAAPQQTRDTHDSSTLN